MASTALELRARHSAGLGDQGRPLNVMGICASAATGRLCLSTLESLISFDLATDRIQWDFPTQPFATMSAWSRSSAAGM